MAVAYAATAWAGDSQLTAALERVAEEAALFSGIARDLLSEETLVQRSLVRKKRFRPRVGAAALTIPEMEYRTRELVSEYGYGAFNQAPGALHEFRQVISVDGKRTKGADSARRTLLLGLRSKDDSLKQKLLKDFEKNGLHGAATDFGQLLLLFTARNQKNYRFRLAGERYAGADRVLTIEYEQREGPEALTVFGAKQATRFRPNGELLVRGSDLTPLRITLNATRQEVNLVRTEATVEYAPSKHGVVVPQSVVHREIVDEVVHMENTFRYAPFKRFGSESELKFEVQ